MLKPRDPLTLKVIPFLRGKDLTFVPKVYVSCGSLVQLIGNTWDGRGEEGTVAAPGSWVWSGALSAGCDFSTAGSSSGALPICWAARCYLNRRCKLKGMFSHRSMRWRVFRGGWWETKRIRIGVTRGRTRVVESRPCWEAIMIREGAQRPKR